MHDFICTPCQLSIAGVVLSFEKETYIVSEGDDPTEVCLVAEGAGLPTRSIFVPIKFVNQTAICKCFVCILQHSTMHVQSLHDVVVWYSNGY